MSKQGYVAFDLGAESGRAILATFDGKTLTLEEMHRFANVPQQLPSGYHWNLLDLWANLKQGLSQCAATARQSDIQLVSLGVDTWGVDFGLVGHSGQLLAMPYAYRDDRNPPAMEKAFDKLGQKTIYDATGIQFMPFNTLFQLLAQYESEPATLDNAKRMLMMPDLLHYFFTGEMTNEATDASTTQMVDPRTGKWAAQLLRGLGLPTNFLGETIRAGQPVGSLLATVAQACGAGDMKVIAPGTHDTASAVAAVPVDVSKNANWAYLSSGTWSLMGVELDEPIVSDQSRNFNFTNERGVAGKIRLLKNIAGLWLVQQVRNDLEKLGESYDYPTLAELAGKAPAFRTLINPDDASFASPGDMVAKLAAFANATGQPKPETPGQMVRCCLESLAMSYRDTLTKLQMLTGETLDVLHIVGGGAKNRLLNQMAADAINRPVIVGPYEATAVGNALTQAIGTGQVADLAQLRAVVRQSFELVHYQPKQPDAYAQQSDRFAKLIGDK